MRASSAKAKGRRCSQETKDAILAAYPELEGDDIQVVPSGVTGEDLWFSPKARKLLPISVECKNRESLNVWQALKQAEDNAGNHIPTLIFKRNRSSLYIALKLDTFLMLTRGVAQRKSDHEERDQLGGQPFESARPANNDQGESHG